MNYIKVGKIIGVRGLKGEVKIKLLTNMQEERFKSGNIVYLNMDDHYFPLEISEYKSLGKADILQFKNHNKIEEVEKYKGLDIYVDDNQEVFLDDNEFFIDELIGLKVYQSNKLKGVVKDVISYPQGDYLLIETESSEKLIPFRDEFIESQDLEKISIIEMEGLL